jgi:hypothetical protein
MDFVRGGFFDVGKIGRKERKGSMSHAVEVKLWNVSKMSFGECFASVTGMLILMQSHEEVKVRFGGGVGPEGGSGLWEGDADEMRFLVGGASGWSVPVAVATVSGGNERGRRWKNDGIVFGVDPVGRFLFLLVSVMNGVLSMIMLVAIVTGSGSEVRKSESASG